MDSYETDTEEFTNWIEKKKANWNPEIDKMYKKGYNDGSSSDIYFRKEFSKNKYYMKGYNRAIFTKQKKLETEIRDNGVYCKVCNKLYKKAYINQHLKTKTHKEKLP